MFTVVRITGAVLSVLLPTMAGFIYMWIFRDELEPKHPANAGAGVLAPMYRHFVEFAIVVWNVFALTAVGFYCLVGRQQGVIVNWQVVHQAFLRLHLASAVVIVIGLAGAIALGQPFHMRDAVTALIGLALLAHSVLRSVSPTMPQC